MADPEAPGWLRAWIATNLSSTVFASVGISFGGVLAILAPYLGGDRWFLFFAGSCIPPGLMALVYTTDWMFEKRLRRLKKWRDADLISEELYEMHRERALEWRAERLYGRALPVRPRAKPRASKRSSDSPSSPGPPETSPG